MTEVIKVLEKQLVTVRNMIQGARKRVTDGEDQVKSEEVALNALLRREIEFKSAIDKLKE